MNIAQKIERIRRQPEHIKLRYVWGSVAACMFFVLIIWILSIFTLFDRTDSSRANEHIQQFTEQMKNTAGDAPSIGDISKNVSSELLNEGFRDIRSNAVTTENPSQSDQIESSEYESISK